MGKKYVIFSDSTCDLSREERIKYGIWPDVYQQSIIYDDEQIDVEDADMFYDRLDSGDIGPGCLKTSSVGLQDAKCILDDIIRKTPTETTIVYAGVSAIMSSGTSQSVRLAMDYCIKEYPKRRFVFIDTQCISNGLGTFLQYLSQYEGNSIEDYAHDLGKHIVHLFTESDLSFSAKSGRYNIVERIAMMMISFAHISPWMYFPSDDKLSMSGRVRRGDKILHDWVNYYIEHVAEDNQFIRIGYGGRIAHQRAEKFANLLEQKAGVARECIQLAHVSPFVGVHTGPTVLSFFFKQKEER